MLNLRNDGRERDGVLSRSSRSFLIFLVIAANAQRSTSQRSLNFFCGDRSDHEDRGDHMETTFCRHESMKSSVLPNCYENCKEKWWSVEW